METPEEKVEIYEITTSKIYEISISQVTWRDVLGLFIGLAIVFSPFIAYLLLK